jgi:hypothetical protein
VIRGGTKRSGYQVRLNRQAGDLQKVSPWRPFWEICEYPKYGRKSAIKETCERVRVGASKCHT